MCTTGSARLNKLIIRNLFCQLHPHPTSLPILLIRVPSQCLLPPLLPPLPPPWEGLPRVLVSPRRSLPPPLICPHSSARMANSQMKSAIAILRTNYACSVDSLGMSPRIVPAPLPAWPRLGLPIVRIGETGGRRTSGARDAASATQVECCALHHHTCPIFVGQKLAVLNRRKDRRAHV